MDDNDRYDVLQTIEDLSFVQTIQDVMGSQEAVIGRAYPLGVDIDAPQMAAKIERWAEDNLADSDREVAAKQPREPDADYYIVEVR